MQTPVNDADPEADKSVVATIPKVSEQDQAMLDVRKHIVDNSLCLSFIKD